MTPSVKKLIIYTGTTLLSLVLIGVLGLLGAYLYLTPKLPSIDAIRDMRLQVPLRIYARSGELIYEFGEMKRTPLEFEEFPQQVIQAVLAAEDDRFFEHPGVDYRGIFRAALHLIRTGERTQGGSTITMQVARNFFLNREKTYTRKLSEIFLALKIENELTKQKILELYLNKIFMGKRAFGFAAAAQVYYGKSIQDLSLPQIAMIAGLPKAPSRFNPIVNVERATIRRNYVLRRMHDQEFINDEVYATTLATQDDARLHSQSIAVEAPYVAEMARIEMLERYGKESQSAGYSVVTTIDGRLQGIANRALRKALLAYDRRHGYRGVEGHVELYDTELFGEPEDRGALLADFPSTGEMKPALVFQVNEKEAYAYTREGNIAHLPWAQIEWARRYVDDNHVGSKLKTAREVLQPGDIIYVHPSTQGCSWLAKPPQVSGALVSLNPNDGAIFSLVGGFDYSQSKFNRVTQAKRQPGSNFKPFIYTAAMDKGFTTASIINDAPVVFDAPGLEDTWRPENYSGHFYGPTRLRQALIKSRNLVSIRLLRSIGVGYAIRYVQKFGFKAQNLPRNLSLALGSGTLTPLEVASAYATFANNGYSIMPYFIDHIIGPDGAVVMQTNPVQVCPQCEVAEPITQNNATNGESDQGAPDQDILVVKEISEDADVQRADMINPQGLTVAQLEEGPQPIKPARKVLSSQTVFLMNTILRDIIRYGTGRGALRIGRKDLAGKTGTTNDQHDAWFSGFNADMVTTAWVGFDKSLPLGDKETGARAALPMWVDYMEHALKGVPETELKQPPGLVSVRIDSNSGRPTSANNPDAIFEFFREDQVPIDHAADKQLKGIPQQATDITQQIF